MQLVYWLLSLSCVTLRWQQRNEIQYCAVWWRIISPGCGSNCPFLLICILFLFRLRLISSSLQAIGHVNLQAVQKPVLHTGKYNTAPFSGSSFEYLELTTSPLWSWKIFARLLGKPPGTSIIHSNIVSDTLKITPFDSRILLINTLWKYATTTITTTNS